MSIDIYKCFDQLVREVVWVTATKAGCPQRIVGTWLRMMDGLGTVNVTSSAVGEVYFRPASIPQGCPLSMMWLGIVVRP
eukprot:4312554-Alexandrium_andersonii.AAC.1